MLNSQMGAPLLGHGAVEGAYTTDLSATQTSALGDNIMGRKCSWCSKVHDDKRHGLMNGQRAWWNVSGSEHGGPGFACPTCFDDLEHRDGVPVHPERHAVAVMRYRLIQANGH